jgi:transcriptional regulator with XRE-family HTH domain
MPGIDGQTLRAWRRSRGWDVPEMARQLRRVASGPVAGHDGLIRMIRDWERGRHELTERYELLYRAVGLGEAEAVPQGVEAVRGGESEGTDVADEARHVMAWLTGTNVSDDAIEQTAQAAFYLAEAHSRVPARRILSEVLGLHQQVQALLQGGKQRLRQARDLMRIDSGLLAHACLLLGDLGRNQVAREYGVAALLLAQEAEADEAIAWSVQAKTARWQNRFVEAAELARRGFEVSSPAPTRVELAYREANAIALFGDAFRARDALRRAEKAAETLNLDGHGISVWSFPAVRQAIFSLSVAIHTGDPAAALRAVAMADSCWSAGDPKVPATWAQVRAGAAMAYLMMDSLDGAAAQIAPVLELAPELRIHTVTGYLENLQRMLCQPRFADSSLAAGLRQQIREFNSAPAA